MPPLASPATVCWAKVALFSEPIVRKMPAASSRTATGVETTGAIRRPRPPPNVLRTRSTASSSCCAVDLAPQICLDDVRVSLHLLRGAVRDRGAEVQDVHVIRDAHHEAHVVLDDEHRQLQLV